ncbi:MAG: hypothetical protein ACK4ZE_14220, partial [Sphingorhabdus sp.]
TEFLRLVPEPHPGKKWREPLRLGADDFRHSSFYRRVASASIKEGEDRGILFRINCQSRSALQR